uniref:Pilin n=1 Tax=uncultured Candidatus Melainabacteria bacterium TaxID=2682970 RepID=A0A650EK83_9BACT|nr:hypothetical protein Melaina855_2390 [uncultured Candidatus Melainabacteria bacterium]
MKKALTIGELLITMAIIGVIATLVLPGFLKDYHNKLYITNLKKTIEVFTNAIHQANIDNNVSYFNQTPYVNDLDTFADKYLKKANAPETNPFANKYTNLNGDDVTFLEDAKYYQLAGGEAIGIKCLNSDTCDVIIDINSKEGPNISGRDFFKLIFLPQNNSLFDPAPGYVCKTNKDGLGCYDQLILDNWEMKY